MVGTRGHPGHPGHRWHMVGAVSARRGVRGLLLSLSLGISILISILLTSPAVAAPLSQLALPQTAIRPAVVAPTSRLAHVASAPNTAHGERAAGPLLAGEGFDPQFTGTCRSWTSRTDLNGYLMEWTPSNGGSNCANVTWSWTQYPSDTAGWCDYYVWVPSWDANAHLYPVIYDTSGYSHTGYTVNENEFTDQWAYIGEVYNADQVVITDANNETGTYIGIGAATNPSLKADCQFISNGFEPQFSGTCRSWTATTDLNGYQMEWTPSNGSTNCANVNWYPSGPVTSGWCDYFLWVPSWDANANVYVGLFNASGTKYYGNTINENEYTDQRAYLGQFYDITQVTVGDNNGQTGTYIGIGAGSSPSLIADC